MKVLKKIGFVLAALIALFLIICLFIDGKYNVEKSIAINAPQEEVYDYIKYLKNQDEFSVWQRIDPNMEKTFTGTDATVGAVAGWSSENEQVGVGEQEIIAMDGKRIDYELRFKEPFEATDNAYLEAISIEEDITKVNWGFKGEMPYPMNFFLLFMDMEEMLGGDLEKGLENLKKQIEK